MKDLSMLLKAKGYKVTPARLAILEVFLKSKTPLDAGLVFGKLKNKKINEVTIYRALTSFEKSGILKKVDLRKESVYFEIADEHHHHIVCTNCDNIEEFENKELEKALLKIKSSKFKTINEHALELFGLCVKCA